MTSIIKASGVSLTLTNLIITTRTLLKEKELFNITIKVFNRSTLWLHFYMVTQNEKKKSFPVIVNISSLRIHYLKNFYSVILMFWGFFIKSFIIKRILLVFGFFQTFFFNKKKQDSLFVSIRLFFPDSVFFSIPVAIVAGPRLQLEAVMTMVKRIQRKESVKKDGIKLRT